MISEKIFLNHSLVDAIAPIQVNMEKVLGYFVNEIRAGDKTVPYSFVAGLSKVGPLELNDDEIILNEWTARDMEVSPGDSITLSWDYLG